MSKSKDILRIRKLIKNLEKEYNYPRRPITHPVTLFIAESRSRIGCVPGLGSSSLKMKNMREFYRQGNKDWVDLTENEKQMYKLKAKSNKEDYNRKVGDWYRLYQYSECYDTLERLRKELEHAKKLKN